MDLSEIKASGLLVRESKDSNGRKRYYLSDPKNKLKHLHGWWLLTNYTRERALVVGWKRAFEEQNLLGDMFSI